MIQSLCLIIQGKKLKKLRNEFTQTAMFEARISDVSIFKKLIDSCKEIVCEVVFDFTPEGMRLQAMDNSHVALVALTLGKDTFEHFKCDAEHSIGLRLTSLSKILAFGNKDVLTLCYDPTKQEKIDILLEDVKTNVISNFTLALLDIDMEGLTIPDFDHAVKIYLSSQKFHRICKEMQSIGDTLDINVTSKYCKFTCAGPSSSSDIEEATLTFMPDTMESGENMFSMDYVADCKSSYALKYLLMFSKAYVVADTVEITMADQIPMVVTYKLDDATNVSFFLAPKME